MHLTLGGTYSEILTRRDPYVDVGVICVGGSDTNARRCGDREHDAAR